MEYAHNREKSELARRQLDGLNTSGSVLGCQFVPSSLVQFTDLQSRCLLITNIPCDISTPAALQQFFSVVSVPTFCQVANIICIQVHRQHFEKFTVALLTDVVHRQC